MTVESPSSPEIEAELTMILDNIILDDSHPSISYKKGAYHLKLNRELNSWERMAFRNIMAAAIETEGFEKKPALLRLHITEDDPEVLELLGLKTGQIIECRFNRSEIGITSATYGNNEVYEIGAIVHLEDELPDLNYSIEANSEYADQLGEAFQSLMNTMNSMGPMTADYEMSVSDGTNELPVEGLLEPMRSGHFISAGVIQTAMANPYAFSSNTDVQEGIQDFFKSSGFSNAFVSGLLFPSLSRDAAAYDFPEL